jgi:serine protease Do
VVYGYLGVKASTPTARERRSAQIEGELGAYVDTVESKSPAEAAGIKPGDIVLTFNGVAVTDGDHFIRTVGAAPVERDGVHAVVIRDGKRHEMTIKLRRREIASAAVTREKQRLRWRGLLLGPIPPNWNFADKRAPAAGVMVLGVGADSPFLKDGVAQGSVITAIAGKPVAGITDLQFLLNDLPSEQCSLQLASEEDSAVVSIQQ